MTAPWPNTSPQQAETSDFRDYLRPIWAHKILIVLLVVVVTAGTYVYYNREPRVYSSRTQIFIGTTSDLLGDSTAAAPDDRSIADQAQLLQTPDVAARVAKRIHYQGSPLALLGAISVAPATGSDFLTLTATTQDPVLAARLANGFAHAFISLRTAEGRAQAQKELSTLEAQLASATRTGLKRAIRSRINQLQLASATPTGGARQLAPALPNPDPISPHPKRNAIFGFALSLLLGIIAAFGLERLSRRIRSVEEAEVVYGTPVIATIRHERDIAPRGDGVVMVADGVRETFRSLRSHLDLVASQRRLRTILVTSAVPEEGKSTVVRNLALVYAEAGLKVAVVEADLRRPTLAKTLYARPEPGLANLLMGVAPLEAVVQRVPTSLLDRPADAAQAGNANGNSIVTVPTHTNGHPTTTDGGGFLHLIASGPRPADPPAMFSAPSLPAVLDGIAEDHDVVLIDSPPLLAVSDAIPLMSAVDGTLLVCRASSSTVEAAERTLHLIQRVPNVNVLGLVVNDVDAGSLGERYKGY